MNLPPSPDVDGVIGEDLAALRGGLDGRGGAVPEVAPSDSLPSFSGESVRLLDICSSDPSEDLSLARFSVLVAAVDGSLVFVSSSPAVELAELAPISLGSEVLLLSISRPSPTGMLLESPCIELVVVTIGGILSVELRVCGADA
jgi:hypothetical protein